MRTQKQKQCDILLVGSFPPPNGGQSVHVRELAIYLQRCGLSVVTINTGKNKEINLEGVRTVRSSLQLFKALVLDYKAKLIHVHTSNPRELSKIFPVYVASKIKQIKWVMTIHSGNVALDLGQLERAKKCAIRWILSKADRIICVNNSISTFIGQWATQDKLETIAAYSIDFSESRVPDEVEAFLRTHSPVISCVGFPLPIYRFDLAIRAINDLLLVHEKIGLVLMGETNNSTEYIALIDQLNLQEHVVLSGNLPRDACLTVISRSTLFLRPTMYDGDSISVREALALGVPVVASDTEFRPAGVAIFRKGDLQDMTKKLKAVLGAPVKPAEGLCFDVSNLEAVMRVYLDVLT